MQPTLSNIIQIGSYLLTIGIFVGTMKSQFKYLGLQISNLEKKVEKHNNLVERTYCLEKRADVMDEKIKVSNHRIDDLEEKH